MTQNEPPVSECVTGVPGPASQQARTEFLQYSLNHPAYLSTPLYNPYLSTPKPAPRPAYTPPAPRRSSYRRSTYSDRGYRDGGPRVASSYFDEVDPDHHDIDPSFWPGFGLGTPSPFTPGWV